MQHAPHRGEGLVVLGPRTRQRQQLRGREAVRRCGEDRKGQAEHERGEAEVGACRRVVQPAVERESARGLQHQAGHRARVDERGEVRVVEVDRSVGGVGQAAGRMQHHAQHSEERAGDEKQRAAARARSVGVRHAPNVRERARRVDRRFRRIVRN
ncbi:MAG: hypothetical protein AAF682_22860 [Planctomycetota bacterium]